MFLFHHATVVAPLGSGSRGNCTYIGTERSGVLVDCGLSTRQIFKRLDAAGLGAPQIEAVLITHEHKDHVGAAAVLDRELEKRQGNRVDFHMTSGTRSGLDPRCTPRGLVSVQAGRGFRVGRWHVDPFTVPHDTVDPVGFSVSADGVCATVITDLGRSTRLVERRLAVSDLAVVEFNHDLDMLMEGAYPWSLKRRVKGSHGHLSNRAAGELLARGAAAGRLKRVFLGHLSQDNNTPELAREAAERALVQARRSGAVKVDVAWQDRPSEVARHTRAQSAKPRARRRGVRGASPTMGLPTRQVSLFAAR
jgi:phosphoribosyl 1,2-cyclic phosphodiesterase